MKIHAVTVDQTFSPLMLLICKSRNAQGAISSEYWTRELSITNVMIVQCSMSLGSECGLGLKWERLRTLCGVLALQINHPISKPEPRHLNPPFLVLLICDSGDKKSRSI